MQNISGVKLKGNHTKAHHWPNKTDKNACLVQISVD